MSARSQISPAPAASCQIRKHSTNRAGAEANATCQTPSSPFANAELTLPLGTHPPRFANGLDHVSLDRSNSRTHAAGFTFRSQSSTLNLVLSHRRHGAEVEAFTFEFTFALNHTDDPAACPRRRFGRPAQLVASAPESQSQKAKTSSLAFHLLAISGLPPSYSCRSGTDPRPPRVDSS